MIRVFFKTAALFLLTGAAHAGCGGLPEACVLPDGEYHLALPETASDPPPLVLFLHSAGSTGRNTINNTKFVQGFLSRGYAVLAPTGSRSFGNRNGRNWNFFPGWSGRDEAAFLRDVIADAAERFGTSGTRVLMSGFSAGGFMVSYLACAAPDTFTAYAPLSGGFWRPHPDRCAGPVKLFQTHGWRDKTVPLEGRMLRQGEFQQGDIFAGLEIWRAANGCFEERPDEYSETGIFWRRKWTSCDPDGALELALFPGGHQVPTGWSEMILDWFETVAPR